MKKLLALFITIFFTGCSSLPFKITGWKDPSNRVTFNNGQAADIVGNPRISCYTKYGFKLTDGYFVKVQDNYLVVDEFGKGYVWLQNNDLDNYCILGERE